MKDEEKIKIIKETIFLNTGVHFEELQGKTRSQRVVEIRHIFHYLTRTFTLLGLEDIGILTNRNHSTVIHSERTIGNWIITDVKFRMLFNAIMESVKSQMKEKELV